MSNQEKKILLRGGQRVGIQKSNNYISVRTKRGGAPEMATRSMDCQLANHIEQQNIAVYEVEPTKRELLLSEMKGQFDVAYASNVFNLESDPKSQLFLTDELTLQFEPGTAEATINQIAETFGINYKQRVKGIDNCFVFLVAEGNELDTVDITNALIENPAVAWCEPNVVVKEAFYYTPQDTVYDEQWHLFHNGGIQLEPGAHVDAEKAWDITRGDRAIIVAVADDGFDLNHPDLSGTNKIVAPRDFQGRDFDPNPDRTEENHGTAVAGVAVAEENGVGVIGIAPGCSLMPIRTSGFLDDNSIETLFEWVTVNGAAVMNNSWGPAALNFPLSTRQYNAISRAARLGRNGKGLMIFFAAGNSNRPVNGIVNETGWPENELSGPVQWLDGFATHPDVIAVAACTSLNTKSFYSSWGDEISVCAPSNNGHPGIGFSPTFPFVRGSFAGRGIVTTDRLGAVGYDAGDYTTNFGGTSSASPLAAGVGALILSANPALTAREARQILESTADKIEDNSTDPQLGFSYGTYDENGHSKWFGFGKVNAFKATQAARGQQPDTGTTDPEPLQFSSAPNVEIPDNNDNGITDTINVDQSGLLSKLVITVNINHSYIGDLVVTLIAPGGDRFVLHNRSGSSGQDINQKYDAQNVPALANLTNQSINGNWQLEVIDLARFDAGALLDWTLDFEISNAEQFTFMDEAGVTIPDADPEGVTRTIAVDAQGAIKQMELALDISHTYVSDIVVELTAPTGQSTIVFNRTGGSADNLIATFSSASTPGLADLVGQSPGGDWQLNVRDLAFRDVGKINRWSLTFDIDSTQV